MSQSFFELNLKKNLIMILMNIILIAHYRDLIMIIFQIMEVFINLIRFY
jgi:hypothetical protein